MANITYIEPDGAERTFDVEPGLSVMEGAVRNNVKGIDADCGGACACSTCHVYIDEGARLTPRNENEEDMLDFAFDVRPTSRLACQVKVTPELDGLIVRMPAKQG